MTTSKRNIGLNIAKLRGLRQITQKAMAGKLKMTQPEYSKIEKKEEIDDNLLELIANALYVSPEAIKNFNEDATIQFITNHAHDNSTIHNYPVNHYNRDEMISELVEENRKLYERLLSEKDTVIDALKGINKK